MLTNTPLLSTHTCSPRMTVLIVGAKAISDEQWAVHAAGRDAMALGPIEDVQLALAIVANLVIDKVLVTSDLNEGALLAESLDRLQIPCFFEPGNQLASWERNESTADSAALPESSWTM